MRVFAGRNRQACTIEHFSDIDIPNGTIFPDSVLTSVQSELSKPAGGGSILTHRVIILVVLDEDRADTNRAASYVPAQ